MKKITLIAAFLAAFTMNAQLFSDDFEDGDIDGWTLFDEDGDGVNFRFSDGGDGSIMVLNSQSWNGSPLTPDNYAVSPAIDITGATDLTLTYSVGGQDPAYSEEVYTVYASTGNTVADFMDSAITVSFNEDLGDDPDAAGALVERTLDLSALEGNSTIYIAFRHHDVTDQFQINIDNIVVDEVLSAGEFTITDLNHYIQDSNLIVTANTQLSKITVSNLLGQTVLSEEINGNEKVVNIDTLTTGAYIASISSNNSIVNFKFIKK